jgi:hypothetical protein
LAPAPQTSALASAEPSAAIERPPINPLDVRFGSELEKKAAAAPGESAAPRSLAPTALDVRN